MFRARFISGSCDFKSKRISGHVSKKTAVPVLAHPRGFIFFSSKIFIASQFLSHVNMTAGKSEEADCQLLQCHYREKVIETS